MLSDGQASKICVNSVKISTNRQKNEVVIQKKIVGHFEVREPAENKRKLLGTEKKTGRSLPLFSSNYDLMFRSRIQKYEQQNEQDLEGSS